MNRLLVLIIILVAVVAMGSMLYVMRSGAFLARDSLSYLNAARQISAGQALTEIPVNGEVQPFNHFPPLYPVLLAVLGKVSGTDPWEASRWLNSLLFAANALLVGLIVYKTAGRSIWLASAAVFFMLTSLGIILIHSGTWTEPVYVFCMLVTYYFLLEYLSRGNWPALVISAIAVAVALLTRYIGLTLVIAELVCLMFVLKQPWKVKIKACGVFLVISCIPMLLWSIRNEMVYGSVVDRQLAFHPVTFANIRIGLGTVASWLALDKHIIENIGLWLIGGVIALGGIWWWRMQYRTKPAALGNTVSPYLSVVSVVFSIVYLVFLLTSLTFADASTFIDMRMLVPIFIPVLMVLLYLTYRQFERGSKFKWVIPIVIGMLAANYLSRAYMAVFNPTAQWRQWETYASKMWQESDIMTIVRSLPDDTLIVTNDPYAIYYFTGRSAYMVPVKFDYMSLVENPYYAAQFSDIQGLLQREHSILIYFGEPLPYLPTKQEVESRLSLELVHEEAVGSVYQFKGVALIGRHIETYW